jgi:hypothetical protein
VRQLPILSAVHGFVGIAKTLYHCHYDLNPNLHFQLVGRKRFILFPPSEWRSLYPFPVHHDFDRRSRVDWDNPDDVRFPEWRRARGLLVELDPGDCLYLPPFWWHHVQTLTTPCVSIACWFYDTHPGDRDYMPSAGAAGQLAHQLAAPGQPQLTRTPTVPNCFNGFFWGLCPGGAELSLTRWLEQLIGLQVDDTKLATDAADDAARKAQAGGEAYAGQAKLRAVAACMLAVGVLAVGQPPSRQTMARLPPLKQPLASLMPSVQMQIAQDLGLSGTSHATMLQQASAWLQTVTERVGFEESAS